MSITTEKRSRRRPAKKRSARASRVNAINAGFGRFRHLNISSEEYAAEKHIETAREDRRR